MSQQNHAAADAADEQALDETSPGEATIDAGDAFGDDFAEALTAELDADTERQGDEDDPELARGLDEDDDDNEAEEKETGDEEADDDGPDLDDLLTDEEGEDEKKREQPRDGQGKFTKASDAKPADQASAGAEKGADKGAAADATKPADGQSAKSDKPSGELAWEPFSVNANKEPVPIGEAKVGRADGHVYLAIAEKDFPRFQQRISRGVVGEQLYRKLEDGLREVEAMRNAPAPKSDAEIDAEVLIDAIGKDNLGRLAMENEFGEFVPVFTPERLENMELKAELAKSKAKTDYAAAEERRLAEARAPKWEEQQANGIVETMKGLVQHFPELKGLTREQLEDVYEREFLPVRNALYYREGDQLFANTQYMYDKLKARLGSGTQAVTTPAADAPASDKRTTPGNTEAAPNANDASASARTPARALHAGNSAPTAKPTDQKGNAADSAERFNRGVDEGTRGAKPRSTSVKTNRTSSAPANANAKRPTRASERDDRRSPRDSRQEQMDAEDAVRRTARNWLKSDSLDLEDDEE